MSKATRSPAPTDVLYLVICSPIVHTPNRSRTSQEWMMTRDATHCSNGLTCCLGQCFSRSACQGPQTCRSVLVPHGQLVLPCWEDNHTRLNWMSLSWSAGFTFGPAFHQHVEKACWLWPPKDGTKNQDHILRTRDVFHFLKIIISEKLTQAEDTLRGGFLRKQILQTVMIKFQISHPKVMCTMWSVPCVPRVPPHCEHHTCTVLQTVYKT